MVMRTDDGGATWVPLNVTTERLDFRDVDAISETTAYLLSIGTGPASRIYKTTDAGATWTLQYTADHPQAFLDAMAFWDADHGVVVGDSIDNQFFILTTADGGRNWTRVPAAALPPALPNEGAFAASGTNVAIFGASHAWFGTGAAARARVLRTSDRGRTWQIAETPIIAAESSGIYSIAFRSPTHGVIVGGNYRTEGEAKDNLARTTDGGVTWALVTGRGLGGFRSVVAYVPGVSSRALLAVGPSGADVSTDDGASWSPLSGPGFHTFSFARPSAGAGGPIVGWGAGGRGAIARLTW
jgi:photosystem II stability/assembly factor-like uncharacterized protein